MRNPSLTTMAGAIFCQACLIRCCPVHLGIFRPAPPMQVHYAGCRDDTCTGCLPPAWVEWDREAREARAARGGWYSPDADPMADVEATWLRYVRGAASDE